MVPFPVAVLKAYDAVSDPVASVKVWAVGLNSWPPTSTFVTPSGELKLIAPVFVVVGKEDCPACVPADSPVPREARSPASNTCVVTPPGGGIVTTGFGETVCILCLDDASS